LAYALEDLRRDVPVVRRKVYLNTGTLGAAPQPVTVRFFRAYEQWQVEGPGWPEAYERRRDGLDRVRRATALLLGAPAARVAFAQNVTLAINWVAQGLDWRQGDEVLVSTHEHPANRFPWRALEAMGKVRVVPWALPEDDAELLEDLGRRIGPRTRLVAVSHVLQSTGRVLPAREIAALCRRAGVLSLIDGAQAVGQVEVDLGRIEPDFYPFSGHKWLLGPVGTSGIYLREDAQARLGLLPAGSGTAESDGDGVRDDAVRWRAEARRFEVGTANWPLFEGLEAALELRAEIGAQRMLEHQRALAAAFAAGLPAGVELMGPPPRGGICTVRVAREPHLAVARLAELGVVTRGVGEFDPPGVRFSFGPYNDMSDVEAAERSLAALVRDG